MIYDAQDATGMSLSLQFCSANRESAMNHNLPFLAN